MNIDQQSVQNDHLRQELMWSMFAKAAGKRTRGKADGFGFTDGNHIHWLW
jgi:hypothetical protein